jgi:hypothetical protein
MSSSAPLQPRCNKREVSSLVQIMSQLMWSLPSTSTDFTYQRLGSPIVEYMRLPQSLSRARSSLRGRHNREGRVMKSDIQWQVGMPDRRGSSRTSVQWSASLAFGGKSVECTLRDISETGAAVSVSDTGKVPSIISLVIAGKPGRRLAEVVWRNPVSLGLRFLP